MSEETPGHLMEMLVPLDGRDASLRAVAVAGRIAKPLGRSIHLFSVSDDPASTQAWLRSQAERLLPGTEVAVSAASGNPAEEIVREAGTNSLVCMATAATLLPHGGHVGSVAEEVVRSLGRPVLLIGPNADLDPGKPTDKIVVPVDGSEHSESVLDSAAELAKTLGAPLWVVTVLSPKQEAAAGRQLGTVPYGAESGYVRHLADDLAKRHGVRTGFEVLHIEDPAQAILDFTGDGGAVFMSTHGRSGLSRLFAGSVAQGVVAGSHRPVVVCRPGEAG